MNSTPPSGADWEAWAERQRQAYLDLEAERDEARATKDVHKERATAAEARAHDAEAKRDALRDDALAAVERMRAERDALAARVVAVQRILAATYYNPAKALSDIREALR